MKTTRTVPGTSPVSTLPALTEYEAMAYLYANESTILDSIAPDAGLRRDDAELAIADIRYLVAEETRLPSFSQPYALEVLLAMAATLKPTSRDYAGQSLLRKLRAYTRPELRERDRAALRGVQIMNPAAI